MPTTISGNDGVSQVQNNTITQVDLTTAILPIGVGQNWVNQTAIRAFGVDYTNDTGRPILVAVTGVTANPTNFLSLLVSGIQVSSMGVNTSNMVATVSAIVPAGATYRANVVNHGLNVWAELR